MLALSIFWPITDKYQEEMLKDLKKLAKVAEEFDMTIGGDFDKFVYELYEDEEKYKIDAKMLYLPYNNNKIKIVIFEFDDKHQRFHEHKKKIVYSDLDDIKVFMRNKYKNYVDQYFFDNVFHCTDDLKEFKKSFELIVKYKSREPKIYDKKTMNKRK